MFLQIENPEGMNLDNFARFVKNQIVSFANSGEYRDSRLENIWNNYFIENDWGWVKDDFGNPVPPTVEYILDTYFNNLKIHKNGQNYVITVDTTIMLHNTDFSIDTLATMINDGTLTVPAYTFIDDVFDLFADELQGLYDNWISFGGA